MQQGASIRISPSWIAIVTIVDMSWETNDLVLPVPQGPWAGELALLAGTGATSGEWDWHKDLSELELWVPHGDPPHRHLVATLSGFTLPALNGAAGTGNIQPGIAPVAGVLAFDWLVAAAV
jgi:hypothetical protein